MVRAQGAVDIDSGESRLIPGFSRFRMNSFFLVLLGRSIAHLFCSCVTRGKCQLPPKAVIRTALNQHF